MLYDSRYPNLRDRLFFREDFYPCTPNREDGYERVTRRTLLLVTVIVYVSPSVTTFLETLTSTSIHFPLFLQYSCESQMKALVNIPIILPHTGHCYADTLSVSLAPWVQNLLLFDNFHCSIEIHILNMAIPGLDRETWNKCRGNCGKRNNTCSNQMKLPDRYSRIWDTWDTRLLYIRYNLFPCIAYNTYTCLTSSRN